MMRYTPTVILQRVAALLCSVTLFVTAGCVMIPYETPEARNNIQRDLKLNPGDIQAVSETNWCALGYGTEPVCKMTQGLGVLTNKGLILSVYKNKTYKEIGRVTTEQVNCAKTVLGGDAEELFTVFTQNFGVTLAPITPGGRLNVPAKIKFFNYLMSRGQPEFKGADGAFVRNTDRKRTVGGIVAGTSIAWHFQEEIWEGFNPCPVGA
ncbi:hypothetical protein QN382_13550 [Pseudomonas sp. 10B1]|uniref:hypothetical protein n=1 Tax=unclassified Pseudomonas TaxID=196821 RepID=UPI002AB32D17|nr:MULTISPECIES: hypothetical protein [unclassified Pseudomonas]MDY7560387.1 hypothetical protein [Pseudomonas sp. AB6]MEA9977304.1 hypothetical protein [Pseudomonas sp. RTS4]MEA9994014.1 hypothetical protein [Pseudomonas sp. AA4]MEB0088651.1 hypothetical protein [Pseudomonas sp. RTI1]MEB0124368.1 hypothetical protein [Pseudomonas sp. CCC1.2]